ncbi:MAG: tRNA (guanosine(37)-N1)-methyltransferase TrmD [Gemmatales bacterium]|nr:tRNA (guanosine(37)-N1)-methyltransferase TrmD [Gemmatales bacterium]
MPIRFDVLTLFPEIFHGYLSQSILRHAIERGLVEVHLWNFRDWAKGKRKNVDDRPYGGGPGMVLMCEPIIAAVEAVQAKAQPPGHLVMLTPSGERLTQRLVQELAQHPRLLLLCGRYEGFDERIRILLQPQEISIGDYVCNGGEVPAMVIIDTVIRLVPGVLGKSESLVEESHAEPGLVEYPQYTRPRVFRGLAVPEVLLSGNHKQIAQWRRQQALLRSQQRHGSCSNSPAESPSASKGVSQHEEQCADRSDSHPRQNVFPSSHTTS